MSYDLSGFRKCHCIHVTIQSRYHSRPENKHRSCRVINFLKTSLRVDVEEEIAWGCYKPFCLLELTVAFEPLMARPQSPNHLRKDRFIPGDQQFLVHQTKYDGRVLVGRENIGRHTFNRAETATVRKLFPYDPIHELLKLCSVCD